MERELNEKTFESRLAYIRDRYLSYIDIKENSSFVIVALHEHLSLTNYIRIIVQALCNNQASIVIPNLFGQATDQTNRSEDDEAFLMRLNQGMIAQAIWDVIQEIKTSKKKIILVGFSIGAALGLKMLEFLDGIEFAMFFYGFPPAAEIKPELIKCRTILYVGTKDKVKFLSDKHMVSACKLKYSQNKLVEIYELSGLEHGFLNPASQHYDEEAFKDCCNHFQQLLQKNGKKELDRKGKQEKNQEVEKIGEKKGEEEEKQGKCQLI